MKCPRCNGTGDRHAYMHPTTGETIEGLCPVPLRHGNVAAEWS